MKRNTEGQSMNISRRKFLGCLGGACAGTVMLGTGPASGATDKQFGGYPGSLGVLHDVSKCIGCRRCEAACNQINGLPAPDKSFTDLSVLEEGRRTTAGAYTVVNRFFPEEKTGKPLFVKKQCNHCLEPACASACFVKALKKDKSGAVVYDESLCVGCRYCMIACPFNIPAYEYNDPLTPAVSKCTLCFSTRLRAGKKPACVEICPKEALMFGERDKLVKAAWKQIFKYPDRYVSHVYGEHEMGGTSWLYISPVAFAKIGMREDLGVQPAAAFTAGPLSAVPIVVGLWPVLLTGIYAISRRKDKIAREERAAAVQATVTEMQAEMTRRLETQKEQLTREKEAAISFEVKKALEEAARQIAATSSGDAGDTPSVDHGAKEE